MISIGRDKRSLYAAYQYLIFGTIGASFILIAIGLMYAVTGTLNIHDLHERLAHVQDSRTLITALAFFIIGIGLKAAIWPLHIWLPDAYTYSPSIVSTFLAGTSTKVFIYVLIRFVFSIFGIEFSINELSVQYILMSVALIAIVYGSLQAIKQDSLKRLLAYSSIAQIGYMILAISLVTVAGVAAGLIHVFNHAIIKVTLFLCVANIIYFTGTDSINKLAGLGKQMPVTCGLFVIAGLSIIGVPLTAGFTSKWFLIKATIDSGYWLVIPVIVISSLMAIVYIWKVVEQIYFKEADHAHVVTNKAMPYSMYVSLFVFTAACIYFGLQTDINVGLAQLIADDLIGARP